MPLPVLSACGPDVTLSSEGAGQSASGSVQDEAGNSASTTVSNVNIDKTDPSVSLVVALRSLGGHE